MIAVIREEELVERSHRVGTHFLKELMHLGEQHDVVKEVRGRGLMITMEFQNGDGSFSLKSMHRELAERGFIVGYKPAANLLRFYPALTIGERDMAQLVENLDDILEV